MAQRRVYGGMEDFAVQLRAWRGSHGWSQRLAAEHLGVPLRTLQAWEAASSRGPDHPGAYLHAMKWLDIVHPTPDAADAA